MALLPIIERELRVALRKRRPIRRRFRLAAIVAVAALLFVLFAALTGSRSGSRDLHQLLCLAGLYTVLRAPQLAAGAFARERRDQTLGLLFLSGLTAGEVFTSKVFSAAAIAFSDLLSIYPMLALPFLIGGISFDLFLATIFCLPNLLLFALAVSLFASVLTDDDGAAVLMACGLALAISAVGPAIYFIQGHFTGASLWWLRLSPAYGLWLVLTRFAGMPAVEFWKNFAVTLAWSGTSLGVAALFLRRLWRERQQGVIAKGWRRRWQELAHGTAVRRRRLAATWLQANPLTWLLGRDRKSVSLAWSVVLAVLSGWILCWILWPGRWPSVPNLFIAATLLNLVLRWIIHYSAAAGLANLRADGSYELLLTTPLRPSDIVWAQLEVLRDHFLPVARTVLVIEVVMMAVGLGLRSWDSASLYVYFAIWTGLLFWQWRQSSNQRGTLLTMWAALNSGRPAHAVWRTFGFNSWIWLWLLFNLRHGVAALPNFPSGSVLEIIFCSIGMFLLLGYVFRPPDTMDVLERRLVSEFREIIREPIPDPHDPRFKKWNVRERFPWGWKMVQQQLHERVARRQMESA